jgi:hypothetical protein
MVGLVLALLLSQADASVDAGVALAPLSLAPDGGLPPRGLRCLPTWYEGTVKWRADAGWGLDLATGVFVVWHSEGHDGGVLPDGTVDEPEQVPDLEDVYATPYVAGPIVPIDTSDAGKIDDPGRVRVQQLFIATYGGSRDEVQARLEYVPFFGVRWPFNQRVAPALARVVGRLQDEVKKNKKLLPFLKDIGGTWTWRRIARSRNLSAHAWGIAIDINVERSAYWRWTPRGEPLKWQNRIPQEVVDAFEAEGFIWGGRWVHYDTMHFEYRPELLSADCRD